MTIPTPSLLDKAVKASTTDFSSIPIIDLTNATSSDYNERHAVAMSIQKAALTAGFFSVTGHGVDEKVVENCFAVSKRFFETAPESCKRSIDMSLSDNFRGYMGLLTENTNPANAGDMHEAFNLGLDPSVANRLPAFQEQLDQEKISQEKRECGTESTLVHGQNLWPREKDWEGAIEFKNAVLAYYSEILALGYRLFPLLALALDMPEDFFADKTRFPAAIQRLLYYPPLQGKPADQKKPGIGEHTDYEVFTVLRQDEVGGLEVKNLSGQWIKATYIPNTFVINIGDQLARWTNDVFRSTVHRALPPPAFTPRYSIPFFWGSDHAVPLTPIPTCISPERPARYEVVTAGEYVKKRLEETYHNDPNSAGEVGAELE